jgi:hypothetical protein
VARCRAEGWRGELFEFHTSPLQGSERCAHFSRVGRVQRLVRGTQGRRHASRDASDYPSARVADIVRRPCLHHPRRSPGRT